ncbi:hypothetical protein NMY22_g17704 [Coprinellus aureogranulatus]|nr:hypothetical protein NMY22_g17704 [Coprinellus aureogranulatus]
MQRPTNDRETESLGFPRNCEALDTLLVGGVPEIRNIVTQAKEEAQIAKAEAAAAKIEVARLSTVNRTLQEEVRRHKEQLEFVQNVVKEYLKDYDGIMKGLVAMSNSARDNNLPSRNSELNCLPNELKETLSERSVASLAQQNAPANLRTKRKAVSEVESGPSKRSKRP